MSHGEGSMTPVMTYTCSVCCCRCIPQTLQQQQHLQPQPQFSQVFFSMLSSFIHLQAARQSIELNAGVEKTMFF